MTFDVAEEFFSDGFLFTGSGQAVPSDNAGDGVVTNGELELLLEAFGAKAGLAAELDDLACQAVGGLVRAVFGPAAEFDQRGRLAGHITSRHLRTVLREQTNSRAAALRPCWVAQATSF